MPRLLDAFCGEQGSTHGYHLAGWDVEGVDKYPKPRAPHKMHVADAIEFILEHGHEYDGIHTGPPCQRYSGTQRIRGNDHPDLIAPTREALQAVGRPYVIENVGGATGELRNPVMLCGAMFGLRTYRHRYFEASFPIMVPGHPPHVAPQAKMGRPPKSHEFIQCVGNFSGVAEGREAMGMPWASRDGLREAIPPAFTEYIAAFMLAELGARAAA
jgi:DNA (cytosine-5)-methyltransferase 1